MVPGLVIRNLRRRPFLNLIKVTGLTLAFSSMLLIALYLKHELSYDRFHSASDRIYRFTATSPSAFSGKHFARIWGARYIPELVDLPAGRAHRPSPGRHPRLDPELEGRETQPGGGVEV